MLTLKICIFGASSGMKGSWHAKLTVAGGIKLRFIYERVGHE